MMSNPESLEDTETARQGEASAFAALRFEGKGGVGRHILGAFLIIGLWVVLTVVLFIPLTIFGPPEMMDIIADQTNWVNIAPEQDGAALLASFAILASIIVMLPALWFTVRIINGRSMKTLITAHRRFQWGQAIRGVVTFAIAMGLASLAMTPFASSVPQYVFEAERFWPFLILVLLLTPVQAFTEEVFVRGYLFQAVSTFTASLAARLILPAFFFMLLHAANSDFLQGGIWAILSYFTIGVYFGYLTVRTDGIEHASGIHTINNIAAFSVISSAGAGMPFATIYFDPNPDYLLGFISLLLTVAIHYVIAFKLLKS